MAGERPTTPDTVNKFFESRWSLLLILAALIAFLLLLLPERHDRLVADDGTGSWNVETAPARREIVWGTATALKDIQRHLPPGDVLTPRLADGGSSLYFAFRPEGKSTDLYRAVLRNGQWQKPEKLIELCSEATDIGLSLSADGQQLWFASNRAGGQGGYDLYVSHRQGAHWSKPRNLGPTINTASDEYDPATTPDGQALYFASNRATREQALAFDLYVARREEKSSKWAKPELVSELSQPDANERAPFVSPSGRFLYFASDRAQREGEERNLDLYRARLVDGRPSAVENLGEGINTAVNEDSPSLSPEGFTLLFVSNREGHEHLYQSRASEVFIATEWDNSRWILFTQWWWKVLLIGLAGLTLFYLIFTKHAWLVEQAIVARFLAISLMIHVLIVLLMAFTPLPKVLFSSNDDDKDDEVAAAQMLNRGSEAEGAARPAYEQMADPGRIEAAPVNAPTRQQTTSSIQAPRASLPQMSVPGFSIRSRPAEVNQPQIIQPPSSAPSTSLPALARRPGSRQDPKPQSNVPEDQPLEPIPSGQLKPLSPLAPSITRSLPRPVTPAFPEKQASTLPTMVRKSLKLDAEQEKPSLKDSTTTPNPLQARSRSRNGKEPTLEPPDEVVPSPVQVTEKPLDPGRKDLTLNREKAIAPEIEQDASRREKDKLAGLPTIKSMPQPLQPMPLQVKPQQTPLPPRDMRAARKPLTPRMIPEKIELVGAAAATEKEPQRIELPLPKVPLSTAKLTPSAIPDPLATTSRAPRPLRGPKLELSPSSTKPAQPQSIKGPVTRHRPSPRQVADINDQVDLNQLLGLRDKKTREKLIEVLGGTKQSEEAVEQGLQWLASIQNKDGSWSLHKHQGGTRSETAGTGLALLPFLGAGYHHRGGKHQQVVARGIDWLIKNQKKNGDLLATGSAQRMYSHGIATIALCEALGLAKDERLREPAQKALNFIIKAQNKSTGGWRYNPGDTGDTSVLGWQIMALKSGQIAGLDVPEKTFTLAKRWLDRVENKRDGGGTFGYTNRSASPAMSAQALLCLEFMGERRSSSRLKKGTSYLHEHPAKKGKNTSYYWYNATQVLYHLQGRDWDQWYENLREMLVRSQARSGKNAGSWNPSDNWERTGGRIFSTSLRLLMLEVPYRHLPLYQSLAK